MHVKFLRVNVSNKESRFQTPGDDYKYAGGRSLIAKLLNEEVNPQCDPLGLENKLIVCPGLLGGTTAPNSGRLSVGGKSPLTNTIKEANAGGTAAQAMIKLGLKAIVIEGDGSGAEWSILKVSKDQAELLPADKYLGLNNYALVDQLKFDFNDQISVISIGGAGEKKYLNSTLQITDTEGRPSRAAARGGLGAVMGSKKIKAIVLDTTNASNKAEYADQKAFSAAAKQYVKGIMENPISGKAMPALGTAVLMNNVNAMGALPINNFRDGAHEDAEKISGENLAEMQQGRGGSGNHRCLNGCVIGCSNVIHDAEGNYLTAGFEYETIALVGANCGIFDLDLIAKVDRLCDDFGLDTMETGCTLAVAMEAGKLEFGDGEGALRLVKEMIDETDFGRIMGQGTEITGKHLGVTRIPTVKGQSLAAYDPRSLKGTGVTYATSPMGADHTAGNTLGNPTVDPYSKDGQVDLSTNLQMGMATFDTLGICIFAGFCTDKPENIQHLLTMMSAKFGGQWDPGRLFGLGVESLSLEKAFNKKAGFTSKDDVLPDFFYQEKLSPRHTVFDIDQEELSKAIKFD